MVTLSVLHGGTQYCSSIHNKGEPRSTYVMSMVDSKIYVEAALIPKIKQIAPVSLGLLW
jgi:hypothetical protein